MKMPETMECPIGSLTGAPYNPREMPAAEMAKLKASLTEFGLVQPLVARKEDGLLLGGHQRLTALRTLLAEQGKTEDEIAKTSVPVVFVEGLDDKRAKALNLALNKISGEWDYARLGDILSELQGADGLPPELINATGFTDREINDILAVSTDPALFKTPEEDQVDVDAGLAEQARRMAFTLATDADAQLVREELAFYGMTCSGDAAAALVTMAKHAHLARDKYVPVPAAEPKPGKKRKRLDKASPEEKA